MKTIILALALMITCGAMSYAQCGKKFTITTSKTDHLDSSGNITRTVDEKAVVVISPTDVNITVNDNHKMTGTVKSDTCSWPVAYKEGKSIIKAVISDENRDDKNVTITITGKNGKVTLLFEMEGQPDDRIRVAADKFEEVM
jgi:osmotically-inducible protein OsmY